MKLIDGALLSSSDTGAAITCMAIKELRKIPSYIEIKQIANTRKICQGASGTNLIRVGTYLMPLEWQGKNHTPCHRV
jgi:hypothetical protein